jgi:hypothetical protein
MMQAEARGERVNPEELQQMSLESSRQILIHQQRNGLIMF